MPPVLSNSEFRIKKTYIHQKRDPFLCLVFFVIENYKGYLNSYHERSKAFYFIQISSKYMFRLNL